MYKNLSLLDIYSLNFKLCVLNRIYFEELGFKKRLCSFKLLENI